MLKSIQNPWKLRSRLQYSFFMLHRTSTWMIATAAMVSLGHLVKPCTFIPHAPSTFPRHFGLQVGLSIQVGSLDIDLGRCRKKIWVQFVPCHESHHWPDWPGMLNMEFGTCAKFHRWSNKDLPAEARKLVLRSFPFRVPHLPILPSPWM